MYFEWQARPILLLWQLSPPKKSALFVTLLFSGMATSSSTASTAGCIRHRGHLLLEAALFWSHLFLFTFGFIPHLSLWVNGVRAWRSHIIRLFFISLNFTLFFFFFNVFIFNHRLSSYEFTAIVSQLSVYCLIIWTVLWVMRWFMLVLSEEGSSADWLFGFGFPASKLKLRQYASGEKNIFALFSLPRSLSFCSFCLIVLRTRYWREESFAFIFN